MPLHDLIPILQIAIGPVILISGVGLLLLTMTNRLGRVVDRSRELARQLRSAPSNRSRIVSQLEFLSRRARIARTAIAFATVSVLLASTLIIVLFLVALLGLADASIITILFISCMLSLIVSLMLFLKDVNLSLAALRLELEASREPHS